MSPEMARVLKTGTRLVFKPAFSTDVRLSSHGRASWPQARRHFSASRCSTAKNLPPRRPREKVEIPGLEAITYGERMHYVPGLAKPVQQHWERDHKDPRFYRAPPPERMSLYKEKPCYVFNQRTSVLEGKYFL